jgi:hypothetical protein
MVPTVDDILFYGNETSVKRFKAHYGPEPWTVKDLLNDLCDGFPDTSFKELYLWV